MERCHTRHVLRHPRNVPRRSREVRRRRDDVVVPNAPKAIKCHQKKMFY